MKDKIDYQNTSIEELDFTRPTRLQFANLPTDFLTSPYMFKSSMTPEQRTKFNETMAAYLEQNMEFIYAHTADVIQRWKDEDANKQRQ